jgi:hypothetical protein
VRQVSSRPQKKERKKTGSSIRGSLHLEGKKKKNRAHTHAHSHARLFHLALKRKKEKEKEGRKETGAADTHVLNPPRISNSERKREIAPEWVGPAISLGNQSKTIYLFRLSVSDNAPIIKYITL